MLISESPTSQSEFDDFRNASAAVAASWQDLSQPDGVIQFISTKEFVQDWETIREALGYEKINIIGGS